MPRSRRPTPEVGQVFDLSRKSLNGPFLRGQLVLEGIMIEALRSRLVHPVAIQLDEINYSRALGLCRALGMINDSKFGLLRKIGYIRNRMAHELQYELGFSEAFALARQAAKAGVQFSDETIYLDHQKSSEIYGAEGIIQALFQNLAQDLVLDFDPNLSGPFGEFFSP